MAKGEWKKENREITEQPWALGAAGKDTDKQKAGEGHSIKKKEKVKSQGAGQKIA